MDLNKYSSIHEIPKDKLQELYEFILSVSPEIETADIHIVGTVLSDQGFQDMDIAIYQQDLSEEQANQIRKKILVALYEDDRFDGIFDIIILPAPHNTECKNAHADLPYFRLNDLTMYNGTFGEPITDQDLETVKTRFKNFMSGINQ